MILANTKEFRLAVRTVANFYHGAWTDKDPKNENMRYVGFGLFYGSEEGYRNLKENVEKYLTDRNLYVENLRVTEGGYLRGKVAFRETK